MGSKGRVPPPHLRHPLPGPSLIHPDPFGQSIRPNFAPFDVMTPPELMEQKLAGQHIEMRKLATENQRLAATHGTLRQELAAAQHDLQILHSHIGAIKSEKEQQSRELIDKIGKIEKELQASETIKTELQQAKIEAQNLVISRQELMSKVHQLNHDLETGSSELHQMPRLLSELDALRQEYQHCRATYDYEKKLYNDHLEHLQGMDKNYKTMQNEVEKLRESLANIERRPGGFSGYNENNASGNYQVGQNSYTTTQNVSPLPTGLSGGAATSSGGAVKGSGYHGPRAPGYGQGYDIQMGHGYYGGVHRPPMYDTQTTQRVLGYDNTQKETNFDHVKGSAYDNTLARGSANQGQGHIPPVNNPAAPSRGGNTLHR